MEMADAVEHVVELASTKVAMVAFRERDAASAAAAIVGEEHRVSRAGQHLHRIQRVRDPAVEADALRSAVRKDGERRSAGGRADRVDDDSLNAPAVARLPLDRLLPAELNVGEPRVM